MFWYCRTTNKMALKSFKCVAGYFVRSSVFHRKPVRQVILLTTEKFYYERTFTANLFSTQSDKSGSSTSAKPKKKGVVEQKITLLGTDGNVIAVTTLAEAQKLSKRRDLRIVKCVDFDTKTSRPVYQLLTGSQFLEAEKKERQSFKINKKDVGFKGEKIISFNHKINEHDLKSKLNKMLGWLAKRYEVRVAITADSESGSLAEKVYQSIVDGIKAEGRIVQKRMKNNEIRFQVLPPKLDNKMPTDCADVSEPSGGSTQDQSAK